MSDCIVTCGLALSAHDVSPLRYGEAYRDDTKRIAAGSDGADGEPGTLQSCMVALDAIHFSAMGFRGQQLQHAPKGLLREVNKAAAAFQNPADDADG